MLPNAIQSLKNDWNTYFCFWKWQFNKRTLFCNLKKNRDKIKSCFLTFSSQTATFTRNPKGNTLSHGSVSNYMLSMKNLRSSINMYSQATNWNSTHSDNINRSDITCTTASLFWKEEKLARKTCILRNKTTVTVMHYDQVHG